MQNEKTVRLQKYISDMGVMSRRSAEKEIVAGNITINGIIANLGDKVNPDVDAVMINNRPIIQNNKKYYVLLNKPTGYITTLKDEFGRKTITSLLKDIPCRMYPVGRLDAQSEGALICTNDGDFANKVIHPSFSHEKIYHVYATGRISQHQLTYLNEMRRLDDEKISKVETRILKSSDNHTVIEFKLNEGKNRQIRRMCEKAEITIMQLKRVSVGQVTLGNLPSGEWRHLTADEIKSFGCKRN